MENYTNPDYVHEPEKVNVKKGLEGAVVDTCAISRVDPDSNSLLYRGYAVEDLAEHCRFEEVAYLLYHGELPDARALQEFENDERCCREISPALLDVLHLLPRYCHPMDALRTAVSFLGCEDRRIWQSDLATNKDKAIRLLAKIPTVIAADYRIKKGMPVIPPQKKLSIAENFFHMCFGNVPAKDVVKAFDVALILYAEHSFNSSTFSARVITSTESDIYSATVGGIGALKGPLHGGANEQVMHMMLEIGEPAQAEAWILKALAQKKKVIGFGHRVYKRGDSRVPTMKKYALKMSAITNQPKWMQIYEILERVMVEKKKIYPNLDYPAGPTFYMMGFAIDFFTPLFVMARTTGWSAHVMEQAANNRIIRPLSEYTGPGRKPIKPIAER